MALTPTVVPGGPITSGWGNEIRDRTVQVFANAAERDSWTSPPNGAICVLTDSYVIQQRISGAWVNVAPLTRSYDAYGTVLGGTVGTSSQEIGAVTLPSAPFDRVGFVTATVLAQNADPNQIFTMSVYKDGTVIGGGRGNFGTTVTAPVRILSLPGGPSYRFSVSAQTLVGAGPGDFPFDSNVNRLDVATFV